MGYNTAFAWMNGFALALLITSVSIQYQISAAAALGGFVCSLIWLALAVIRSDRSENIAAGN
jgi:hypothetical protein